MQGMAHLEEKRLVHRDLAARNVLGTLKKGPLKSHFCSFISISEFLFVLGTLYSTNSRLCENNRFWFSQIVGYQ